MNILVYAPFSSFSKDQYEIMRGESRILHNIGFGLAQMGYYVNIVNHFVNDIRYENRHESGHGDIYLSQFPIIKKYDFALTWFNHLRPEVALCDKSICMVTHLEEILNSGVMICDVEKSVNKSKIFVTPYRNLTKYLGTSGINVEYLPPIFPIPSYHLGFKDYNYNSTDPIDGIFKVFVYISSWEKNLYGFREYNIILKCMTKYIRKYGHKIKLYIQLDSEDTIKDLNDSITGIDLNDLKTGIDLSIKYIYTCRYDDYLRMIDKMDLFLIKGSQHHSTAGIYDIISLGKPMIYVSLPWDESCKGVFRNPLNEVGREIIYMGDSEESIKCKIEEFMKDPKIKYDKFRDTIKDSNFNNWKILAQKIFTLDGNSSHD